MQPEIASLLTGIKKDFESNIAVWQVPTLEGQLYATYYSAANQLIGVSQYVRNPNLKFDIQRVAHELKNDMILEYHLRKKKEHADVLSQSALDAASIAKRLNTIIKKYMEA